MLLYSLSFCDTTSYPDNIAYEKKRAASGGLVMSCTIISVICVTTLLMSWFLRLGGSFLLHDAIENRKRTTMQAVKICICLSQFCWGIDVILRFISKENCDHLLLR